VNLVIPGAVDCPSLVSLNFVDFFLSVLPLETGKCQTLENLSEKRKRENQAFLIPVDNIDVIGKSKFKSLSIKHFLSDKREQFKFQPNFTTIENRLTELKELKANLEEYDSSYLEMSIEQKQKQNPPCVANVLIDYKKIDEIGVLVKFEGELSERCQACLDDLNIKSSENEFTIPKDIILEYYNTGWKTDGLFFNAKAYKFEFGSFFTGDVQKYISDKIIDILENHQLKKEETDDDTDNEGEYDEDKDDQYRRRKIRY